MAARAAAAMGIGCSFAVPCKAGGWPECRLCDSLCLPPAARVHSQAKKGLLSTALVVKAVELAKLFPQAPAGQPSPANGMGRRVCPEAVCCNNQTNEMNL